MTDTDLAERLLPSPPPPADRYWLTRFLFLRLLGVVYLFAFLAAALQVLPLVGRDGLLPAEPFLREVKGAWGGDAWWRLPTLFWLDCSDGALQSGAWLGVALSALVVLGLANVPLMLGLWALYLSFVHVGQLFWGYGWELLLTETGFLAVFLCPLWRPHPFDPGTPPPRPVFWLLRWLVFRLMLGAGLIKLRGDACWRDLSCLLYHYETQPIPNPLSWYFHHLPGWIHKAGVLFNHLVELPVAFLFFGPRPFRHAAGVLTVAFQLTLILSGNLSFLNWLTIVVALSAFDDSAFAWLVPKRLLSQMPGSEPEPSVARRTAVGILVAVVALLSLGPAANMLSRGQAMNASFDPFNLVNTYGAFGSVTKQRDEIVLQGTDDEPSDPAARWIDYELPCKPGDVMRRPCVTSPYHRRLDWQMWFAAMSRIDDEPWLVHLVARLLEGDQQVLGLLAPGPWHSKPPRFIRAELFRYRFTSAGEPGWWTREGVGHYMPALSRDDPMLKGFLTTDDWAR